IENELLAARSWCLLYCPDATLGACEQTLGNNDRARVAAFADTRLRAKSPGPAPYRPAARGMTLRQTVLSRSRCAPIADRHCAHREKVLEFHGPHDRARAATSRQETVRFWSGFRQPHQIGIPAV